MKVLSVEDLEKELAEIRQAKAEAQATFSRVVGAEMFCSQLIADLKASAEGLTTPES